MGRPGFGSLTLAVRTRPDFRQPTIPESVPGSYIGLLQLQYVVAPDHTPSPARFRHLARRMGLEDTLSWNRHGWCYVKSIGCPSDCSVDDRPGGLNLDSISAKRVSSNRPVTAAILRPGSARDDRIVHSSGFRG